MKLKSKFQLNIFQACRINFVGAGFITQLDTQHYSRGVRFDAHVTILGSVAQSNIPYGVRLFQES